MATRPQTGATLNGTLSWDAEFGPIWRRPCGALNPLRLSDRRWIAQCPVCQQEPAPGRWLVEQLLSPDAQTSE